MAQIFISCARRDGADESLRLYTDLQRDGIGAWRDNRIDPTTDFTSEIEAAIDNATHVAVIVTPDLKRADSLVRLEIGYALTQKKTIIPLVFPGGHRLLTIINHTYISFADWDAGYAQLRERIKNLNVQEIDPQMQREYELAYLQKIGQQYDRWRDLYTDMAATARIEAPKVKLKAIAQRMIEMRHAIHQKIDHSLDAEKGRTVKTESLDELRAGLRDYRRVALIGDPGAGKTTTLERLAYEYASAATLVPEADADRLLYFAVSASILDQTDTVRFSHQLLQAYFAVYERGEDLMRGVPVTKYFPSDEWWMPTGWEETALLLAGMLGDAGAVVVWLTPVQPDLACKVATESGAPCHAAALQALYEPADEARRSPYAVAEWGRLNHENDRRPGVGLRPDGLPDIAWCDIAAGKFLYGEDKQEREMPCAFKMAKYPVTYV